MMRAKTTILIEQLEAETGDDPRRSVSNVETLDPSNALIAKAALI